MMPERDPSDRSKPPRSGVSDPGGAFEALWKESEAAVASRPEPTLEELKERSSVFRRETRTYAEG